MTETKWCNYCKTDQPLSAFAPRPERVSEPKLTSNCKLCRREINRAYRQRHPRNVADSQRRFNLQRQFGLSEDDYTALLVSQGEVCAICGLPESKVSRLGNDLQLSVDHDHATGRVRGLLCGRCNPGLAMFADSPERLEVAADYIRRSLDDPSVKGKL